MTLSTSNLTEFSRNASHAPATAEPARNNNYKPVIRPDFVLRCAESSPCENFLTELVLPALARRNHKAFAVDDQGTLPAGSLAKRSLPRAKSNLP